MLGDAISYPRKSEDWLKTILIGGILSLIGAFVFVTYIPLTGYFVRVLRSAASDGEEPPVFDEWGELIVDGLKALVISLVYVGIPTIVLMVGTMVLGAGGVAAGGDVGAGLGVIGMLFALVMFVVVLVAAYAVPAALTNFALDEFGAAFDFRGVLETALTGDYFVAWVLAAVVGIVGGIIGSLLSIVLIGVFVLFYVQVVTYYLFGRGYAKARGIGGGETGTAVTA